MRNKDKKQLKRRTVDLSSKPKKERKPRKKPSKKTVVIACSAAGAALVALTVGLCLYFFLRVDDYRTKFRTYTSAPTFTDAEASLTLPLNTQIDSYDAAYDVFITKTTYIDADTAQEVVLYGLCGIDENYVAPVFSEVVSLREEYAVVVKQIGTEEYIGVIRFRKDGRAYYKEISDFSLTYLSTNEDQMYFCGKYICMLGSMEDSSLSAAYSTFYDYTSQEQMLEVFRVRFGFDTSTATDYTMLQADDYLAVYNANGAYFYNLKSDFYGPYREYTAQGEYVAFPVLQDSESDCSQSLKICYMGNGWFMRSAKLYSETAFDGYDYWTVSTLSDSSTVTYYHSVTDFFNVETGVTRTVPQLSAVIDVANRYNAADYDAVCNGYNNGILTDDEGNPVYDLPYLNPAGTVLDGYSVVYYYYRPYIEQYKDSQGDEYLLASKGEMTYCLLDENMAAISPETMMPVVFADGKGFCTSDPYYDPYYGNATVFDYELNGTDLEKAASDGIRTYTVSYANKYGFTVMRIDLDGTSDTDTGVRYAAYSADGKRITDFLYTALTPIYDGYAIGEKTDGEEKSYYRIDMQGKETAISEIYALRNGVFITKEGDKYGLKNFAGTVLLSNEYSSVTVLEKYLSDGVYQTVYAVATKDGIQTVYRLH